MTDEEARSEANAWRIMGMKSLANLRGIPAIGKESSGGAMPGTRPDQRGYYDRNDMSPSGKLAADL